MNIGFIVIYSDDDGDWNMNCIFPYIGNVIIPIDELIFFRGVGIPPTRYIYIYTHLLYPLIHHRFPIKLI